MTWHSPNTDTVEIYERNGNFWYPTSTLLFDSGLYPGNQFVFSGAMALMKDSVIRLLCMATHRKMALGRGCKGRMIFRPYVPATENIKTERERQKTMGSITQGFNIGVTFCRNGRDDNYHNQRAR